MSDFHILTRVRATPMLDWLRAIFRRFNRSTPSRVLFDEDGFILCNGDRLLEARRWDDVDEITAWKQDLWTYDEIFLRVHCFDRNEPIILRENVIGYSEFCKACERRLPGLRKDWWSRVAFPAFEENATVIFSRPAQLTIRNGTDGKSRFIGS